MPFYEYTCASCGSPSEFLQRVSDPPERVCPQCGEEALIKQISAAGFRLKGKGWYETDFKSEGKRNLAGEHTAAKAEPDGSTKSAPEKTASAGTAGEAKSPKETTPTPATKAAAQPASSAPSSTGKRDASATVTSGA